MKKLLALALVMVLALSLLTACGDNNTSGGGNSNTPSGNNSAPNGDSSNISGQSLITDDVKTGEGSEARQQYFADTIREEFTFDKNDALTGYKKIYTFVDGADKDKALERITAAGYKASIDGNTLVVDGDGNYSGFPYADTKLDEIKGSFDSNGAQYTLN